MISRVGTPRRRAALDARSGSVVAWSRPVIELKFTTRDADLMLDGDDDAELLGGDERVAGVFEIGEQRECLVELVPDLTWRLSSGDRSSGGT